MGKIFVLRRSILFCIFCVIFFITIFLYNKEVLFPIEKIFYDLRFRIRGVIPSSTKIIIVAIDEESLNSLGRWPWDRKVVAEGVKNLFSRGAKVVVLDILYPEHSNKESDLSLSKSLKHGNSIVAIHFEKTCQKILKKVKDKFVIQEIEVEVPVYPIPEIKRNTKIGFANVYPDKDGVPRKATLYKITPEGEFLSLNAIAAETFSGEKLKNIPKEVYINYYGPMGTFPNYSFVSIYKNLIPEIWIKDKIVLIGATATGVYDHYPIPFQSSFPGVELHANIIENILNKTYLTKIDKSYYFIFLLILTLISAILFSKIHPVITGGLMFLLSFVFYFLTVIIFTNFRFIIDFVPAGIIILSTGFVNIVNKVVVEQREKQVIKNIFSKYVSTQVMEELLRTGEELSLGGKKMEITVLFSDIRKFTTLSEQLPAEEVVVLLNEYFEVMSRTIFKYNGTLDKYIGDAIMCFWNAPLEQPDHADRAVRCAIDMIKELDNLNKIFVTKNKPVLSLGVGINTGYAIVGNVGSATLMAYTAVGDTVNTASRLQDLTKEFNVPIIISEYTKNRLSREDRIYPVSLGKVQIRGKTQEIEIFSLELRK